MKWYLLITLFYSNWFYTETKVLRIETSSYDECMSTINTAGDSLANLLYTYNKVEAKCIKE